MSGQITDKMAGNTSENKMRQTNHKKPILNPKYKE